jgi:hypothetical protein
MTRGVFWGDLSTNQTLIVFFTLMRSCDKLCKFPELDVEASYHHVQIFDLERHFMQSVPGMFIIIILRQRSSGQQPEMISYVHHVVQVITTLVWYQSSLDFFKLPTIQKFLLYEHETSQDLFILWGVMLHHWYYSFQFNRNLQDLFLNRHKQTGTLFTCASAGGMSMLAVDHHHFFTSSA